MTPDIDVARINLVVAEEVRRIAAEEGRQEDWLNASAAPWVPSAAVADILDDPAAESRGLTVRYASPENRLAMKLAAFRSRDLDDILLLIDHLHLRGEHSEALEAILREAYPGEGELQQAMGVPEDDLDNEIRLITTTVARLAAAREDKQGSSRPGDTS